VKKIVLSDDIIISLLFFAILVIAIIWMVVWYKKNNVLIEWVENKNGANIRQSSRARLARNGKFYKFADFFSRKPVAGLDIKKVKDYFIISESGGMFSPKLILKLKKSPIVSNKALIKTLREIGLTFDEETVQENKEQILENLRKKGMTIDELDYEFSPYGIPSNLNLAGITSDYTYSFCLNKRIYLYEITKTQSRGEILARIILPVALIVLCIFLIIYFPTLYDKLVGSFKTDAINVLVKWGEAVTGTPPPG